ncbi:hypothetical protein [Kribbella sp. NPDC048915]|uniref:hypothetical protein n=1 Tax=Kribbella sp. NPDC048915 TaxID=3155148 RepID=UPI0033F3DD66
MAKRRRQTTPAAPQDAPAQGAAGNALPPVQEILQALKPYLELLGVAGALAIPLAAVRVLAVAGWNRETALALVANSSTGALAVALLVLAVPLVIAFWITATVIDAFAPGATGRIPKFLGILALVAINTMIALSWLEIVAYAFLPAIAGTATCLWARRLGHPGYQNATRDWLGGMAVVLGAAAFSLAGSMWLPPERVVIDGEPELAYVLGSEDDTYVVFLAEDNVVARVPHAQIQDRQYCMIAERNPIRKDATGLPHCPGFSWWPF